MNDYTTRAEKILSRINELASITEEQGCITRIFGTPAFIQGSKKVFDWMKAAGLQTSIDNIGNVRGKLVSENTNAKTFVIASHIDTVVNAGKFDGPLGVLMGLDIIENLKASQSPFRGAGGFNIELIAFSDEEGCRFHTTYLGSKVIAGSFDKKTLEKKDTKGITLKEAIITIGGDADKLAIDAIDNWLGYFEIHIEQGPVLYEKQVPVAVVTAIAGQRRAEITFTGVAGHAGTVPMDMRHDALATAAEFIVETEEFALENKEKIVATVGKLEVHQSASNVIPGKVTCSLDLRSSDETTLLSAYNTIKDFADLVSDRRKVKVEWNLVQQSKPTICNEELTTILKQSISEAGYPVVQLISGAGHDGVPISAVSPITMLFVRCFEGISHNPLENAETKDIAAAIKVSDNFIQRLITLNS
jgi:allantoate deiminase